MTSVTIGLDVSDRYSRMCVLDSKGRVMEEGRVRTSPEGLARRFGCEEPARVVLEVGTHSPWMSEQLKQLGHEVLVANPRRLKLIYGEHDKTDRLDAEHLARVGRMDPKLLKTVQHRGRQARADLAVIRSRDALVKSRTQLVSHVRGAVKSAGCRIPRCSTPAFARTAPEHIPERLKGALEPVLETIAMLTGNIQQYERQIVQLCQGRYPETQQLQQVAGVGALTALAYVLTLEEPERFNSSIPERLKGALEPVLETIAMLTGNIQQYERQIVQLCQGHYELRARQLDCSASNRDGPQNAPDDLNPRPPECE